MLEAKNHCRCTKRCVFHDSVSFINQIRSINFALRSFDELILVNLGDFGDSLAQVAIAQFDIDLDPIAFGDLLLHDFGIGHWHRPCLSGARLECNRMLDLIDTRRSHRQRWLRLR